LLLEFIKNGDSTIYVLMEKDCALRHCDRSAAIAPLVIASEARQSKIHFIKNQTRFIHLSGGGKKLCTLPPD